MKESGTKNAAICKSISGSKKRFKEPEMPRIIRKQSVQDLSGVLSPLDLSFGQKCEDLSKECRLFKPISPNICAKNEQNDRKNGDIWD